MSRLKLVAGAASADETVYSEAFEQLDAGLCIIDGDGAVLTNNQAFCRLLDLPFDWGSPKAAERAIPASEELVTGWLTRIASEGGLSETVALSDRLTLRVVGKALPSGCTSLTLTEAADADRRALDESEAGLRQAQRLARIGHWERNLVTGEIVWSDAIFEFFGFEKGPAPEFDRVVDRLHPEDRDILRGTIANVYDGNAYQEVEFRVVSRSGEVRHLYDVLEAVR